MRVAHIEGDDILPQISALQDRGETLAHMDHGGSLAAQPHQILTANAYFGGWGIAKALETGADVVIAPRVTDSALVVGPAAWYHGWRMEDLDQVAGAVVAGHAIECGPFSSGGNFSFFTELERTTNIGYPIAEVSADGSAVITKQPGSDGAVTSETVIAQLLYEISGPRYLTPDVVARLDSVAVEQVGPDRVRISGVRGEPAPTKSKVCVNFFGGYRNDMTLVLTGLDIPEKARFAEESLRWRLGDLSRFDEVTFALIRSDKEDADRSAEARAFLTVTVKGQDEDEVGREFSDTVVELFAGGYPGFYVTSPPTPAKRYGIYWPALLSSSELAQVVVDATGSQHQVPCTMPEPPGVRQAVPSGGVGETPRNDNWGDLKSVPLGYVMGARSGDKGGNANVGVWARTSSAFLWLEQFLTVDRFKALISDAADLKVERSELPNLRALNFLVYGLLGDGVASTTYHDPQAKGLGEYLRSRVVDVPISILSTRGKTERLPPGS